MAEIMAERNPVITIEHKPDFSLLATKKPKKEPVPIFFTQADRDEYEKKLAVGG